MNYRVEHIAHKEELSTLRVNGYLLHSKYNPVAEAKRVMLKEFKNGYVHILFGYGQGYLVNAFKEIANEEKLIIIDPLKEVLKINSEDVYSMEEFNEFKKEVYESLINYEKRITVICSMNYEKIVSDEYKEVLEFIRNTQRYNQVQENTFKFGSMSWQENKIKSLVLLSTTPTLATFNRLNDKPIVIASGGPSLTKQLVTLNKYKGNLIIIAAGSAINSLLASGITPDFVVSIDGTEYNYHHFKNIKEQKTTLLYSFTSNYNIQQNWSGNKYTFLPIDDGILQQSIKKKFNVDIPLIDGGGSVANFALAIAHYMSSGSIALIGQDLAYTDFQTHAVGNKYKKEISQSFLEERQATKILGYYGDEVWTDYGFKSMIKNFNELSISLGHETCIYNCTEGGAKINEFVQIPFEQYCLKYANEKKVLPTIKTCSLVEWELIKQDLMNQIQIYQKLIHLLQFAILEMKKDYYRKFFSKQTIQSLAEVDKELKEKLELTMFSDIATPLIMEIMKDFKPLPNETKEQKFERIYQQNMVLYKKMVNAITVTSQYTKEAIQMGDDLNE